MSSRSKYGARKTTVDGITFDSHKEAERYIELRLLQRAGKITKLKLQPEYELLPGFTVDGIRHRKTVYRADFEYVDERGKTVVEDVKGMKTDVYRLKKKLFAWKYKMNITEY